MIFQAAEYCFFYSIPFSNYRFPFESYTADLLRIHQRCDNAVLLDIQLNILYREIESQRAFSLDTVQI